MFVSVLKDNYDEIFVKHVLDLKTATVSEILHGQGKEEVQVKYSSTKEFGAFAKRFKLMDDLKVCNKSLLRKLFDYD